MSLICSSFLDFHERGEDRVPDGVLLDIEGAFQKPECFQTLCDAARDHTLDDTLAKRAYGIRTGRRLCAETRTTQTVIRRAVD